MQIVQHNLVSMFTQRQLNITTNHKAKNTEKLSSGYRINRGADDAAGLAISEKMRWQIRGLNRASDNIQDGLSFCNVADGALSEVHSMLARIRELSVQASNDTNTPDDRKMIDDEVQQIKEGIEDIFDDTMYNTKFIFRVPYIPNVSGNPTDMTVFNSSTAKFGGVELYHVRYTWSELGAPIDASGKYTTDFEKEFRITNPDGESEFVRLVANAGDSAQSIRREYSWRADDTGIQVNDVSAVRWSDLGINSDADVQPGMEIHFQYHGMNVSFTTGDGDHTIGDLITGINGDFADRNIIWKASYNSAVPERAVDTLNTQYIQVSEDNKNTIDGVFSIRADQDGVTISDTNGNPHTKMSWSELFATGDSADGTEQGWGLSDGTNLATFSENILYRYTDTKSGSNTPGLTFSLYIQDQSSREAVINGLNGVNIGRAISAPVTGTTSTAGYSIGSVNGFSSFDFQRAHQRNFDSQYDILASGTAERTLVEVTGGGEKTGYRLNSETGVYEECTYKQYYYAYTADLTIKDESGNDDTVTFSGKTGNFYLGTDGDTYDTGGRLLLLDADGNQTGSVLSQKSSSIAEMKTSETGYGGLSFSLSKQGNLAGSDSIGVSIRTTDYAKRLFDMSGEESAGNTNREARYRMEVIPPVKMLHIQSGAKAWQDIPIEWSALNNSILGISGTNTRSYEAAQAAIDDMDHATEYISKERSRFGAYQNRLEYAYRIDQNSAENTQAGESRIRDTDMAKEMVSYSKNDILAQAGQAMLSQANQQPQGILTLLR